VRSIKPDLIRRKNVGAARDLCLRRETVSSIRNRDDGSIRSTLNSDMNKKQICPGSSKGPRSTTSSTKAAEPTNSQLGETTTDVTNPSDARETLENGSIAGIGPYLHDDVASVLKLIAKRRHRPSQRTKNPPGYDPDLEFEFDTADVTWAIENGHSGLVGDYLRELGKLMTVLGDMLDLRAAANSNSGPCGAGKVNPKIKSKPFSKATSIVI
jgi:hypothetical protein